MPNMPLSVLCNLCKAIDDDEISQMIAAGVNVMISEDLAFLMKFVVREIQDEDVRNWALNELKGVEHDSNNRTT